MSTFMLPPVMVLPTLQDVQDAMAASDTPDGPQRRGDRVCGLQGGNVYRIKSTWLISLIDEIDASGQYPYNATVKRLAEQRMDLPPKSDAEYAREGDTLSLLIYNAQGYRRHDQLVAAGYEPFTAEVIERAHREGKLIELHVQGLMGTSSVILGTREIAGKLVAMGQRKRKYHLPPNGQPVRLVAEANKEKA